MPAHTPIDYVAAWATFGTALGTLGLAIATFVLATKTRALAKSGQETADAAKLTADAAGKELPFWVTRQKLPNGRVLRPKQP